MKIELTHRQTPRGTGAITASTHVSELARLWLNVAHGWSTGTERTYRSVIDNEVVPGLGELRLREVSTGVVSRALGAIADRHGPSAAKSSKACLSGMFWMAIEDGAPSVNPVRESSTRISVAKKSPRVLTPTETAILVGWLRANERAVALAVEMMRTRPQHSDGIAFAAPSAHTLRDPSNASGDLRQLLDSFDCDVCARTGYQLQAEGSFSLGPKGQRLRCVEGPWSRVTSHVFGKTVATRLDEAGFTARQVADQLGHAHPSMTLDVYFGRQVVSAAAARVLDR